MIPPKTWIVCRTCLSQKHGMTYLYSTYLDLPLWSILRDVTGIPIRKDDNFSDKICETCVQRLWNAYGFRLECQRAHSRLSQVVQYGGGKCYGESKPITEQKEVVMDMPAEIKIQPSMEVTAKKPAAVPRKNKKKIKRSPNDAKKSVKSSTNVFICKICKKMYSQKSLLRQHMYIHKRPHFCRFCGKCFGQAQQFINHMNFHMRVQPYKCRICPVKFSDMCNRNKHERNVHQRKLIRKMPKDCFICSKKFATTAELRKHHKNDHLQSLFKDENDD